uniref:Peptidylprolyl isomerase n=1 Tax=Alexandrium monilatum TaxID=311494 RepID=A0A6T0VIY8_9DINO|mmetsp:Transcript_71445/g.213148  ORF Transcript_71445/g.213148 Transcript_71445/m.213148 type:complete len:243 (+) Transcript_71445:110-838(+)
MKPRPSYRRLAACLFFVLPALAVRPHGEDLPQDALDSDAPLETAEAAVDTGGRPQQPPTQPRPSNSRPFGEKLGMGTSGWKTPSGSAPLPAGRGEAAAVTTVISPPLGPHGKKRGVGGVAGGTPGGTAGAAAAGRGPPSGIRASFISGMLRICASAPVEGDVCQFRVTAYWLAGISVAVLEGESFSGDARRLGMRRAELEARIKAATKLGAEQRCAILDRFCGSEASMLAKDEVQAGSDVKS